VTWGELETTGSEGRWKESVSFALLECCVKQEKAVSRKGKRVEEMKQGCVRKISGEVARAKN
jgi:hypothetical protein